jgi:hypothetical protein
METYYWGLLIVYYLISNYLLFKAWVKEFDLTLDYIILCLLLFWIIGPLIWLTKFSKHIIIKKKR